MNIAICDDDVVFANRLKTIIQELPGQEQIKIILYQDGDALLEAFEDQHLIFDLILLDIEMPLVDGIEVAKEIRKSGRAVVIIFITNYPKYALPAHRVQPFYYLLKNSSREAIQHDITKALEVCRHHRQQCLLVESRKECLLIPYQEIIAVESFRKKVDVHTTSTSTTYTYYCRIADIAKELETQGFFRIHRSILVNLNYVENVFKKECLVSLSNGMRFSISRSQLLPFLDCLREERRRII